jgi:hypothetical protein
MITQCRKEFQLSEKFGWKKSIQPLLALSNFCLFPKVEEFLCGKWMITDEEVEETVTDSLNGLTVDFYDEGFIKFMQYLEIKY